MIRKARLPLVLLIVMGVLMAGIAASGGMLSVQVRDGQVRATPSFLGKLVGTLHYGDRVTSLDKNGDWNEVSAPGLHGWMHQSALTKSAVSFQAGGQNAPLAASGDELALAGKGFNKQVENAFKAKNPQLDYAWVDRMETMKVSPEEMARFLQQGGLSPEGGDR